MMHGGLPKPRSPSDAGALSLGPLLVASGLLSQEALDEVLVEQKIDGRRLRLGELLEARGLVQPHQLAQFLSHQFSCPWVSLQRVEVTREAVDALPRTIALKHHMVPVHLRTTKGKSALYVAMDDPTDETALAEASTATKMPVKAMVALSSEIRLYLEHLYGEAAVVAAGKETGRRRIPSVESFPSEGKVSPAPPEVTHRAASARPPKPPPPKTASQPPPLDETILDDLELLDDASPSSVRGNVPVADEATVAEAVRAPVSTPNVVVIGASAKLLIALRKAAAAVDAQVIAAPLPHAAAVTVRHAPCAILVAEEVYAVDRLGLDRIALDAGAQLLVSSDELHERQLEALLERAVRRWRSLPYEKGTVLEGRYELLRDLGGRLAGSRWEVRHVRTGRRSKLKIGVRAAEDGTDAVAIRRERAALARVHHPGAVDLRDAGNTELGDPYVVVEMLEGRTLEGLVAARGALPPEQAAALVHRLAEILAAVHDAGVRHGAVAPANVLIVRSSWGAERAKLIQWESATIMEDREGGSDGTHNVAHDLAGLGACAFFAFTGRKRREGERITSAGLPPKVAAAVERALLGRDRFASVKDFIDAFEVASPNSMTSLALLAANPERRGVTFGPTSTREPMVDDAPLPSELRQFGRAPYRTPIRLDVSDQEPIEARTEDISETGLLVVTRSKVPDGTNVTLRFALPMDGSLVSETGVVRWSRTPRSGDDEQPRAIGIELSAPGDETARQIARYVGFMTS